MMRLDHYVKVGRNEIHWLAIGLSTSVIIVAGIIVIRIINNSLYNDFKQLELSVLRKNERRSAASLGRSDDDSVGLQSRKSK